MFDKSQFTMLTMKLKLKEKLPVKKKDKKTRFSKLQYLEINFMTISCNQKNPVLSVNILGKKISKLSTLPTLIFWRLLNIFKAFFEKKKIGTPSECQTLWNQIMIIRIEICYQQTTKVTPARKEALGLVLEEECFESTIYCSKKE